jgi:hypothetical protein
MTLEAVKRAVERLSKEEQGALLHWLRERTRPSWDAHVSKGLHVVRRVRKFKKGDRVRRIPGSGRRSLEGRLGTVINDGIDSLGVFSYAVLWNGNKAREYIAEHWLEKAEK